MKQKVLSFLLGSGSEWGDCRIFLANDDGNGLSEELFVCDSVIRVLPFKGLLTICQNVMVHMSMSCTACVQTDLSAHGPSILFVCSCLS